MLSSRHITGVHVLSSLSPGATKDGKGQEGKCVIGRGGRQQRLQRATATANWRRPRGWQIAGVYVLPPLVPSMMSEAAEADDTSDSTIQQPVQWTAVVVRSWRNLTWHIIGVCVPPPLELPRMAEAEQANVPSDSRTSKNISYSANEVDVTANWPRWNPHGVSFKRTATNNPIFRVLLNVKRLFRQPLH